MNEAIKIPAKQQQRLCGSSVCAGWDGGTVGKANNMRLSVLNISPDAGPMPHTQRTYRHSVPALWTHNPYVSYWFSLMFHVSSHHHTHTHTRARDATLLFSCFFLFELCVVSFWELHVVCRCVSGLRWIYGIAPFVRIYSTKCDDCRQTNYDCVNINKLNRVHRCLYNTYTHSTMHHYQRQNTHTQLYETIVILVGSSDILFRKQDNLSYAMCCNMCNVQWCLRIWDAKAMHRSRLSVCPSVCRSEFVRSIELCWIKRAKACSKTLGTHTYLWMRNNK